MTYRDRLEDYGMLDFYLDYCKDHIRKQDYLGVGYLLKELLIHHTSDYDKVMKYLNEWFPDAIFKINRVMDEHCAHILRLRQLHGRL